eukprot:evm.model.scf_347.10 EVM.evm.TU.scf_347.10   scf_347:75776-79087(-)
MHNQQDQWEGSGTGARAASVKRAAQLERDGHCPKAADDQQVAPRPRAHGQLSLSGHETVSSPSSACSSAPDLANAIFVSIPAYRDAECQWTMKDAFEKAAQPDLVRFGVAWQLHPEEDEEFVRIAGARSRWKMQVRDVRVPYTEATGPCRARALAQALWHGEGYHLQIDAHTRFVQDWDVKLRQELHDAESMASFGKAVISTYPCAYEGEGPAAQISEDGHATLLCADRFDHEGMLRLRSRTLSRRPSEGRPIPSRFWAAGFSFSRSKLLQNVPYDPNLPFLFFGEELAMLARLWTSGWDVFAPTQPILFHQWERKRKTIWTDGVHNSALKLQSQNRVMAMLIDGSHYPDANPAGSCHGLGDCRPLSSLWEACGIDLRQKRISERALWGGLQRDAFLD